MLDLLHTGSVAFFEGQSASPLVQALTGVGFVAASALGDGIFGGCLVYDLVALAAGQGKVEPGWGKVEPGWGKMLGGYAVVCGAVVGLKNWLR